MQHFDYECVPAMQAWKREKDLTGCLDLANAKNFGEINSCHIIPKQIQISVFITKIKSDGSERAVNVLLLVENSRSFPLFFSSPLIDPRYVGVRERGSHSNVFKALPLGGASACFVPSIFQRQEKGPIVAMLFRGPE